MLFKQQILEAVFLKIGALKNFTKIIGKYLYQSLFLLKLQAYSCNFIKKEASAMVCSCEFCKTFKNTFLIEHLKWLPLRFGITSLWKHLQYWYYRVKGRKFKTSANSGGTYKKPTSFLEFLRFPYFLIKILQKLRCLLVSNQLFDQ